MVPSPAVKSWNANPKTRLTMTREIRLARRRGSRHQYRMSRASSAPSWVRGTARSRRGYSAVTALYPSAGLDLGAFEPLEAVPVMALSSDAENASTSRAIATTVIDRRATATSGRPAATSYGAANGAASGVQDRTSAMPRSCWPWPAGRRATHSRLSTSPGGEGYVTVLFGSRHGVGHRGDRVVARVRAAD